MRKIRITGEKKTVQSALTRMMQEVWMYEQMRHRQIGQYSYLASLIQTRSELMTARFPSINTAGTKRSVRWVGR